MNRSVRCGADAGGEPGTGMSRRRRSTFRINEPKGKSGACHAGISGRAGHGGVSRRRCRAAVRDGQRLHGLSRLAAGRRRARSGVGRGLGTERPHDRHLYREAPGRAHTASGATRRHCRCGRSSWRGAASSWAGCRWSSRRGSSAAGARESPRRVGFFQPRCRRWLALELRGLRRFRGRGAGGTGRLRVGRPARRDRGAGHSGCRRGRVRNRLWTWVDGRRCL